MLHIGIALTFGWTIIVVAWSIGHISGGHLNFAVTFAFMLLRKITVLRGTQLQRLPLLVIFVVLSLRYFCPIYSAAMYFIGQLCGGLVGISLLKSVTPQAFLKVHIFTTVFKLFNTEYV